MKKFETLKLFYDEYPYKIVIYNSLSYIFRDKNLPYAKNVLDSLQYKYEKKEPLTLEQFKRILPIDTEVFFEAKNLFIELSGRTDYKLRIQNPYMQVYSLDYDWLMYLSKKIKSTTEFWEPTCLLEKGTILVPHHKGYDYKVTLDSDVNPELATWILNNPGKVKAGKVCLDTIKRQGYTRGLYLYVRDERVLQLLSLFTGKTQRIDKLVTTLNSDK